MTRILRYDLRDDKAQDLVNKSPGGACKISMNEKFQVLTVQGLCSSCMDNIFSELNKRPDPGEYMPVLPRAMPQDLKHIVRDYVQPSKDQKNCCCFFCKIDAI